MMEAATGKHGVPHQARGQPVHGGGQGRDLTREGEASETSQHKVSNLASLVPSEELHLVHHVVFSRAGVKILPPNHHQNILTALGKPFYNILLNSVSLSVV